MPLPLRTERLLIRELTREDLPEMHQIFSDPEVMEWIPSGVSRDLDHSRERLQWMIEHQEQHGFSLWAIEELATGQMVGDCGLIYIEGKGPEIELAYHLDRSRWGRGYGGEAAGACLDYAFTELGIPRVIAVTEPNHFVSRRVMEKIGMVYEGRVHYYGKDLVQYGIFAVDETA